MRDNYDNSSCINPSCSGVYSSPKVMTHDKLISEYRGRFPLGGETWVLERHRDEVEQFLIEKVGETEKTFIRDLRNWMKGKNVTKEKVRRWCNKRMEENL